MTQPFTLIDPEDYENPRMKVEKEGDKLPPPVHGFSGVMPGQEEFAGKKILIKVCGVGGGGGNAVERMIEQKMEEVDFIAINTDFQALSASPASVKIQIGAKITDGLGTGGKPEVGYEAAEKDRQAIHEALLGAHMIFLTAGMGGGTGTGAAPIVAEIAKEVGALTVAVVTFPFEFEGPKRRKDALEGIKNLKKHVDALIVIPNDKVVTLKNLTVKEAFLKVDEVLHNGIRAITDLIKIRQLVNIDFGDVRTVLQNSGRAHLGIGFARGENRSEEAVLRAIDCNLLDSKNLKGARGAIINIHGGSDMKIEEVYRAGNKLSEILGPQANIIFGAMVGREPREEVCITVIAAGFPEEQKDNEFIPKTITSISNVPEIEVAENKKEDMKVKIEEPPVQKESPPPAHGIINEKREDELFPQEEMQGVKERKEDKKDKKPVLEPLPTWLRRFANREQDNENR